MSDHAIELFLEQAVEYYQDEGWPRLLAEEFARQDLEAQQ